jgi:predicted acylesterase/phospholipase RssA
VRALVLSGGGAHGAYEAGVATSLLARESYDIICGVSIGAINAALIAAGRTDDALGRFWHEELPSRAHSLFPHVPRLRRLINHVGSIRQGNRWRNVMSAARAASALPFLGRLGYFHKESLQACADALAQMVDLSQLRVSLLIGATNASRASAAVFRAFAGETPALERGARLTEYHDLTNETFVMALLASSAMPGLFSPIELKFNGTPDLYADGCIVHTSPLGLAIDNGASEVTVVFVDRERDSKSAGASLGLSEMAYNIATLWQQRLLDYELRIASATNEIVRLGGAPGKREITIRSVRPERPLDLDMLAFDDKTALAAAFERGVADGAAGSKLVLPQSSPEIAVKKGDALWEKVVQRFPLLRGQRA